MERLSPLLAPSRLLFVFIGIPRLVYSLHIWFLPRVREINERGSQSILQNLSLFKHLFGGFKYPDLVWYGKAHWIATNVTLSCDRLLVFVQQHMNSFTLEEVLPLFEMPQKASETRDIIVRQLQDMYRHDRRD
jgi:hypothetical protein